MEEKLLENFYYGLKEICQNEYYIKVKEKQFRSKQNVKLASGTKAILIKENLDIEEKISSLLLLIINLIKRDRKTETTTSDSSHIKEYVYKKYLNMDIDWGNKKPPINNENNINMILQRFEFLIQKHTAIRVV